MFDPDLQFEIAQVVGDKRGESDFVFDQQHARHAAGRVDARILHVKIIQKPGQARINCCP